VPGIPHPPKIGKNVRRLRKRVGYNLDDLSRRCGVSKGMLSQIEGDRTNPTLATIWKIAHGLGVQLEELFDTLGTTLFEPVHADQVTIVQSENGNGTFRIISPLSVREVETYFMEIQVKGEVISPPHTEGTIEILYVSQGSCEVVSGNNKTVLTIGDSISYQADVNHGFRNTSDAILQGFLTVRPGDVASPPAS
jgi:transcriptional regulator with XRE-family HTH domain